MALLCQKLGISAKSKAQNTCLPLHVIIGLIDNGIMDLEELYGEHRAFVKGLLSSRSMRDGYPTIAKMFTVLRLWGRVCVRIIDKIEHDKFTLLDKYFGDLKNKVIYLAHIPWHFFLVKLIDF